VPADCRVVAVIRLGLKPWLKSAVPEGLGVFVARFPTVETVGSLRTSREAGLATQVSAGKHGANLGHAL